MATIRPFAAIRYARRPNLDLSKVIAPPYDVLNEHQKAELLSRDPHNIVGIDLPHLPAKTAGPDSVYEQAAGVLNAWLKDGTFKQDRRPALYPYCQTYEHHGRSHRRRGFFALVKLAPFGTEIIPHERTYKGPIEDRLKLMRATGVQLSPIFGLYSDPNNQVASLLYHNLGRPEHTGTLDDVRNDLWSMPDAEIENQVIDLLATKPVYIADGHHRYTTALQYQAEVIQRHGGHLPDAHPANWCLFVLISMQDDGLLIHPTHRLLGGLPAWDADMFLFAIRDHFDATELPGQSPDRYLRDVLPKQPPHTFGLFDGATRKLYELRMRDEDVLHNLQPEQSEAWRNLDVAILQHYLIEQILQPRFAGGREIVRGYTADPDEVAPQTDGQRYQIALLLQSTPLQALEHLGKRGEVMPQKSTFFYPKLATGMVINPLR